MASVGLLRVALLLCLSVVPTFILGSTDSDGSGLVQKTPFFKQEEGDHDTDPDIVLFSDEDLLPPSLEHLFQVPERANTTSETSDAQPVDAGNISDTASSQTQTTSNVTVSFGILLVTNGLEDVFDLKASYDVWQEVWSLFVDDLISSTLLDSMTNGTQANITQVDLEPGSAKIGSFLDVECPAFLHGDNDNNGKGDEENDEPIASFGINVDDVDGNDNDNGTDQIEFSKLDDATFGDKGSTIISLQFENDGEMECFNVLAQYTLSVTSDTTEQNLRDLYVKYTRDSIREGQLQITLLSIDSDSSWAVVGPASDYLNQDSHNLSNVTMTIQAYFDIFQYGQAPNNNTMAILQIIFEQYVIDILDRVTEASDIVPVTGQTGVPVNDSEYQFGPGGSFGVDPCLFSDDCSDEASTADQGTEGIANETNTSHLMRGRGHEIALIPETAIITGISSTDCNETSRNDTSISSCQRAKGEFQLFVGGSVTPTIVYGDIDQAVRGNIGLLEELFLNSDSNVTFSVGTLVLDGFELGATVLPAAGNGTPEDLTAGPTVPPTLEGTEIVSVDVTFLVESELGITGSYMNTASNESPTKRRLIQAFQTFVTETVETVETAKSYNATRMLQGRRRLEVVYDSTSVEIYRYVDDRCPSEAAATTRQDEGSEEGPVGTCFVAFAQFQLFVAGEELDSVYNAYFNAIQSAIELGELDRTLDGLFPGFQLDILGPSDKRDTDFVPYEGYVRETQSPTQASNTSTATSAPSSGAIEVRPTNSPFLLVMAASLYAAVTSLTLL